MEASAPARADGDQGQWSPSGHLPVYTVPLLAATVLCTVLARTAFPGIYDAVRRDPEGLRSGQVWRLVSPVLVQPDPFWTTLAVLVLVALASAVAEWHFGHWRFAALYLIGALSGHLLGEWWQPYSGGASVAGCGVLGGLLVWLWRSGHPMARAWTVIWLAVAVVDTVLRDIHGVPILAGTLLGLLVLRGAEPRRGRWSTRTDG